jgi:hypothetical protein
MLVIRRVTFIAWACLTLVLGAALLIAPGRFLDAFGWQPVEPILDRILGAALLALSWLSWRGWRTSDRGQTALVMQTQAVFCALGALGILRHLAGQAHYPLMVWLVFVLLAVFAVLWLVAWATTRTRPS